MSLRDNFKSPVLPLPQNLQRHIEAGWKKILSQKQLFSITIPKKSKYNNNETFPRPFPKLSNLIIPQSHEEDLQRRNSLFTENKILLPRSTFAHTAIRARGKSKEANKKESITMKRSSSNLHSSRRKPSSLMTKTGRPISAPMPRTRPRCLSEPTPILLYRTGSSIERLRKLQISSVDLQKVPDDLDHLHDQMCKAVLHRKRSRSVSSTTTVMPSNNEGLTSNSPSVPWPIQNQLNNLAREGENERIRRQVSDLFIDSSSDESKSDLIAKGVKLLSAGREIIENSKQDTQANAETLEKVALQLHELVTGELRALKEENESLKAANRMLKQQLISFTRVEDAAAATIIGSARPRTTPTATPSTSQKAIAKNEFQKPSSTSITLKKQPSSTSIARNQQPSSTSIALKQQPSSIKDVNENRVLHVQPPKIEAPVIKKASLSSSKDIVSRVTDLEETVTRLLYSNIEQTSRLQDRMYAQETRYEETLSKFEEVIANMTTMFAGLQASYNIQNQSTNSNGITTSEITEALETIVNASRKRVQFKGILKQ